MVPFTDSRSRNISSLGEKKLLGKIRQWLGEVSPPSPRGMGDDAAVLSVDDSKANLVTVDSVLYGCHFDDSIAPERVGAKLLKRNLSDIAAMGGRPTIAVVGLFLPPNLSIEWLERFYLGLRDEAKCWSVKIVGGDITQSTDSLGGHLTQFGHAERPLTREGAQAGDAILVTGSLGGSRLSKHVDFVPRLPEGQWLAQFDAVHSMIDLSDGLAKDLPELLSPEIQAVIETGALPLSEDALKGAEMSGRSAIDQAFGDGEDHELLFTLSADLQLDDFIRQWKDRFGTPITHIGRIEPCRPHRTQARIIDRESGLPIYSEGGYEHFLS